jgi:hypothetical protein
MIFFTTVTGAAGLAVGVCDGVGAAVGDALGVGVITSEEPVLLNFTTIVGFE